MPRSALRQVPWDTIGLAELAAFIWEAGVSVVALRNLLNYLQIQANSAVAEALLGTTEELLRQHLEDGSSRIAQRSGALGHG